MALALAMLITGCVTSHENIVAVKTTTLGFDVSGDPGTYVPHVRLGLIRNFYQVVPVGTNAMFAPSYAASMSADMRIADQTASEDFAAGEAATLISAVNATNNTAAKLGVEILRANAVTFNPSQLSPLPVAPVAAPVSTNAPAK